MSSIRSRSRSRSRSAVATGRARVAAGVVLAGALLASNAVASAAPGGDDPRGINRVFEAPGTSTDPNAPVVALTFDDGPHPVYTPQVLDILKANGVQATFFIVGREAEKHPDLLRRIAAEGHIIGNHTWNHAHLSGLPDDRFAFEVDHTTQVLEAISGQEVVCTRPPYGDADAATIARLAEHGQASVVWSADSRDFEKPGAGGIVQHALEGLRPGGIVLFHDGGGERTQTIAALQGVIDGIRARGYGFATACDRRVHKPSGSLEAARSVQPETIDVRGWVADPDTQEPTRARIYLDGTAVLEVTADLSRPDVASATGLGDRHGFSVALTAPAGDHEVCVHALNAGLGDTTVDLGCKTVTVIPTPWYDQLGRLLALLGRQERWEASTVSGGGALDVLVETLLPDRPEG